MVAPSEWIKAVNLHLLPNSDQRLCLEIYLSTKNHMLLNQPLPIALLDMVLSKSKEKFATRLTIESQPVERVNNMIHLGVWLSEDLTWNKHVTEICKRCYPRVKMLTKLKFVGVPTEDLITIHC